MEYYYKYRSLSNLRWFLDILINKRLYASKYLNLNDPMEGAFCLDKNVSYSTIAELRDDRANTLICSLSKTHKNGLMWSMYADEHRGCCIELEVTSPKWKRIDVTYTNSLPIITEENASVDTILSIKSNQWKHEEEVRFIQIDSNSPYLKIRIKRIYFGMKMNRTDFSFYKNLLKSLGGDIEIIKMKREDIDFGFNTRTI